MTRITEEAPPHPVLEYPPPTGRAGFARYVVLAFLCSLVFILYIDRVCIGQAEQHIRKDLGLSKTQMGWVFTAFTLAYGLFEVPTGHWGDRRGSRGVIARIVIWWSLFTALTGAAWGLWSLMAIRFLFGAGEAGAFPNAARVVTRWFPAHRRGLARGAITTVSLLGAAASGILTPPLIQSVGWRWTFVVFGVVGVAWAAAFYFWFRDDPAEHRSVNPAELDLIRGPDPAVAPAAPPPAPPAEPGATPPVKLEYRSPEPAAAAHAAIPWGRVLTSANVWLLGAIMTVSAMLFYMLSQWYPTYLKEARGQSEASSGSLTAVIMIGGAAGCIAGGLLSDLVVRLTPERKWSRRLCGGGLLALAATSASAVRFVDSAWAVTLCTASAVFFMQAAIPTWWAVVAEISGRHGAAMWGLMNSMALFGVMAVNVLVGWYVDFREAQNYPLLSAWGHVFGAVTVALALGVVSWMLVDATRSAVEPRRREGDGVTR